MSLFWLCSAGYCVMGCVNLLVHKGHFSESNIKSIANEAQEWQRDFGGDVLALEAIMSSIRKSMFFVGFFLWPTRLFVPWPEPK